MRAHACGWLRWASRARAPPLRRRRPLKKDPEALRRVQPTAVPAANDPLYAQQWHLSKIFMPAAWAITTGSKEVMKHAAMHAAAVHSMGMDSRRTVSFAYSMLLALHATPSSHATYDPPPAHPLHTKTCPQRRHQLQHPTRLALDRY